MLSKNIRKRFLFITLLSLSGFISGNPAPAQVSTIEDKLNSITDAQRKKFGVVHTSWVSSDPPFGLILGCRFCDGANYDIQGPQPTFELLNPTELNKIPFSYLVRIPENDNGKLIIIVPTGNFSHTYFSGLPTAFNPIEFLKKGYRVVVMNLPNPGANGFPLDDFIDPPYSPKDLGDVYLSGAHMLKELVTQVFGAPLVTYSYGSSRGVGQGNTLFASREGNPFDGYLMVSGASERVQMEGTIEALKTNRTTVPKTCYPILTTLTSENRIRNIISLIDPDFLALVDEGLASLLNYEVSDRPLQIQKDWGYQDPNGDIQKKTVIIQGLLDRQRWPGDTLAYVDEIIAAGRTEDMRLYLFNGYGHSGGVQSPPRPPASMTLDAMEKLDGWVQNNEEPGPIDGPVGFIPTNANFTAGTQIMGEQPSCAFLGFPDDPGGCLDQVLRNGAPSPCD